MINFWKRFWGINIHLNLMEGSLWILLILVGDVVHKKHGHWFSRYYWSVVPELGFPSNSATKNLPVNMGDMGELVPPHSWGDSRTVLSNFATLWTAQSCLTLCDPMNRIISGLLVHHQLPEFTQTHVHWVSDVIQPSHPLLSPSPPTLILYIKLI